MSVSLCCFFSLICLATVGVVGVETAEEECKPAQCRHSGPAIRFPFWLKGHQHKSCGYPHPNFQLSCSNTNNTELDFQYTIRTFDENIVLPEVQVKVQVLQIDYTFQRLNVSSVKSIICLPNSPPVVNSSSADPFMFEPQSYYFGLLNCSSGHILFDEYFGWRPISCSSAHGYQTVTLGSYGNVWDFNLSTCTKLYDIDNFPLTLYDEMNHLTWVKPSCRACEAREKHCRLMNNSRADETECCDFPKQPGNGDFGHSRKLAIAGEGGYGTVYKGNLSYDILVLVAVKVLNNFKGNEGTLKRCKDWFLSRLSLAGGVLLKW